MHGARVRAAQTQLLDAFSAGCAARVSKANDFGPAAHYASALLRVTVMQTFAPRVGAGRATAAARRPRTLVATLTLADIAGAERSGLGDAAALRVTEGPTLNRGVLAMGALASCLRARGGEAAGDDAALPYEGSKLTLLLREALGGNCRTTLLLQLQQGEGAANRAGLSLGAALGGGVTYPVVNDGAARGLLRRLRARAAALESEVSFLRLGRVEEAARVRDSEADVVKKLTECEARLVGESLDRLSLASERDELLARLTEARGRLVEAQRARSEEAARAAEAGNEALRAAGALLDAQIEGVRAREEAAKVQYEVCVGGCVGGGGVAGGGAG